jgi:hypothetical protein
MIIESAFHKLPDYFQSIESPKELYEFQLSFIFAVAIFQEFQLRGFPYLINYIQLNRNYPAQYTPYPKELQNKVDIYVKIPKNKLPPEIIQKWANCGVCEENWIEVKFFGGAERRKRNPEPITQNLGKLLNDLLRLKFFIKEGGKYLLFVFDRHPRCYLPFKNRSYLNHFLTMGEHLMEIDFSKEPKTVIDSIKGEEIVNKIEELIKSDKKLQLKLLTYAIVPRYDVKGGIITSYSSREPVYFFYLIRLLE